MSGLARVKKQIQERFAVVHDSLAAELAERRVDVVVERRPLAEIAAPIFKVVERRRYQSVPVRGNVHVIVVPKESAAELMAQLERLTEVSR
jgi:hypothetical protein